MLRSLSTLFVTISWLGAQAPTAAPAVRVPTFANSTCPIMGKQVSMPLFADTERGRIYVCCRACIKKVLADVTVAYATAYPTVQPIANSSCPVSGEPIGAHRQSVELQGVRFDVCCAACVAAARRHSQVTLARVHEPALVEVGNGKSPVDGKPVEPNAYVVVGTAIVRLSSPAQAAEVKRAPQALLDKARSIRAEEPQAPHRHGPSPAPPESGKEASQVARAHGQVTASPGDRSAPGAAPPIERR